MKTLYIILAFILLTGISYAQFPPEFTSGSPLRPEGESHVIADKWNGAGDSVHVFNAIPLHDAMGVKYDSIRFNIAYSDSVDYLLYVKLYGSKFVGLIQDTTGFPIPATGEGSTLPTTADAAGFTTHQWSPNVAAALSMGAVKAVPIIVIQSGSAMASDGEHFSLKAEAYHKDRN